MLQVGVGVSTQYDDTVMMNVESHQLALRSVILGVISDFTEEDIEAQLAGKLTFTLHALNVKLRHSKILEGSKMFLYLLRVAIMVSGNF